MPVVRRLSAEDGVAAEGAESAVEVADGDAEEDAADGGEDGVAEVTVERRHGSGLDGAGEAVAHDEVVAFVRALGGSGGGVRSGSWRRRRP